MALLEKSSGQICRGRVRLHQMDASGRGTGNLDVPGNVRLRRRVGHFVSYGQLTTPRQGQNARAGARQENAQGACAQSRTKDVAHRGEHGLPGRLMQPVAGGDGQMLQISRGECPREQRDPPDIIHSVVPRYLARQELPGLLGRHRNTGNEYDGSEAVGYRHADRDPAALFPDDDLTSPEEGGRSVVRVSLDFGRDLEQALLSQRSPAHLVSCRQPRDDGRRAAAQTTAHRDLILAGEAYIRRLSTGLRAGALEGPDDEVRAVRGQDVGALAADLDPRGADLDLNRVPDVEGHAEAIESRPQVRGCGGHLHDEAGVGGHDPRSIAPDQTRGRRQGGVSAPGSLPVRIAGRRPPVEIRR